MKITALAAAFLVGTASAFSPAAHRSATKASSVLNAVGTRTVGTKKVSSSGEFAYGLPGSLPPVKNFDPLGLSKKQDEATVRRWRECEIMHGRFAQMAVLGFLIPENIARNGGFGEEYLEPDGTALSALSSTPELVYLTLGLIAGLEAVRLATTEPGTRTDAKVENSIGFRPKSDDDYAKYQINELQNGRLAMLAIAGEVAQELVNGKPLLATLEDLGAWPF